MMTDDNAEATIEAMAEAYIGSLMPSLDVVTRAEMAKIALPHMRAAYEASGVERYRKALEEIAAIKNGEVLTDLVAVVMQGIAERALRGDAE